MDVNNSELDTVKKEELAKVDIQAAEILTQNATRTQKAIDTGNKLLSIITDKGMSDDLDIQLADYLKKIKKTKEFIQQTRKPITSLLDAIKSRFTGYERQLNISTENSVGFKIQAYRTNWAQKKIEKQKEEEKKQLEKQQKILAIKELKEKIGLSLESYFNDFLILCTDSMYNIFNSITLENFEENKEKIKDVSSVYEKTHFDNFTCQVTSPILSLEEKKNAKKDLLQGKFEIYSDRFKEAIDTAKINIESKLLSKKAELEELKSIDASKREGLQKQKEEQLKAEREKRIKNFEDQSQKALITETVKDSITQMQGLFDSVSSKKIDRSGYSITVLNNLGFVSLFQFWFEKEGKNLPQEKIEKKSMKQIKTFCEKYAHKNNELITSAHLQYTEIAAMKK